MNSSSATSLISGIRPVSPAGTSAETSDTKRALPTPMQGTPPRVPLLDRTSPAESKSVSTGGSQAPRTQTPIDLPEGRAQAREKMLRQGLTREPVFLPEKAVDLTSEYARYGGPLNFNYLSESKSGETRYRYDWVNASRMTEITQRLARDDRAVALAPDSGSLPVNCELVALDGSIVTLSVPAAHAASAARLCNAELVEGAPPDGPQLLRFDIHAGLDRRAEAAIFPGTAALAKWMADRRHGVSTLACAALVLPHMRQGVLDLAECAQLHGGLPSIITPAAELRGVALTFVRMHQRVIEYGPSDSGPALFLLRLPAEFPGKTSVHDWMKVADCMGGMVSVELTSALEKPLALGRGTEGIEIREARSDFSLKLSSESQRVFIPGNLVALGSYRVGDGPVLPLSKHPGLVVLPEVGVTGTDSKQASS